jgi:multiple sugar transport system ATP-binding protein
VLKKKPRTLSGGQRQRVAMGRAIVREPQAFLMDEPLSNLDAKLRVEMRAEIQRIQRDLSVTTIYVTHDQTEAMTMGDRVAVMRAGRIVQAGAPQNLYDHPIDLFVAGFMGSPAMNLVRGRVERGADGLEAVLGHQRLRVPPERTGLAAYEGREVVVGIRPEVFEVSMNGAGAGRQLVLPVLLTEALGSDLLVHLGLDAPPVITGDMLAIARELPTHGFQTSSEADTHARITARIPPGANARAGDTLSLLVDPNRLHFFDPETELAIA